MKLSQKEFEKPLANNPDLNDNTNTARNQTNKMNKNDPKNKKEFKFIDLFAGIGGIRLGFEAVGGTCVFTSEWDNAAQKTYEKNHGEIPHGDITKITSGEIPDHDILLAGFPCQAFSIAGLQKGLKDPRGQLFLEIVRILEDKKPKAFLLENVRNLLSHDGGKTYQYIKTHLENLSGCKYKIHEKIMNTATHGGLPQNRERVYIVGVNPDAAFEFPEELEQETQLYDLLEENAPAENYYEKDSVVGKELHKTPKTKNLVYQWRRNYLRINKKGVSPTLMANMGTGGHNIPIVKDHKGFRKFTLRECLRLQGFPEEFEFPKEIKKSEAYKQIGNSVSVPVVARVAERLVKTL